MPCYHLYERVSDRRDKNTTQITVHVQHTTGLLSGNRSGGGSSFTAVIYRTRNLLSVGCSAGRLLFLLQKDSFIYFSLAILSTERYVAMKFSLRYASIVTTPRLIGAVVCSWLISAVSLISWLMPVTRSTLSGLLVYVTVIPAILVVVFCHTTVYFVSRRHMNQIKIQHLSSETKAKFQERKKGFQNYQRNSCFLFLSFFLPVSFICTRNFGRLVKINRYPPQELYPESQIQLLPIAFS